MEPLRISPRPMGSSTWHQRLILWLIRIFADSGLAEEMTLFENPLMEWSNNVWLLSSAAGISKNAYEPILVHAHFC
jgi:hypothetical protein